MNKRKIKEYRIWKALKARCNAPSFANSSYQLKGISVCDRWKNSYENFYSDMGKCPEGYSIDRIDNNGDYSPENCRWSSQKEQCSNRGDFNILFTYKGETKVLKAWAEHFDIKYSTLYLRIMRNNIPFEEAIIKKSRTTKELTYNGKTQSISDWSRELNIKSSIIADRIRNGWTIEKAFFHPIKKCNNK